jgi:hypothetical protein
MAIKSGDDAEICVWRGGLAAWKKRGYGWGWTTREVAACPGPDDERRLWRAGGWQRATTRWRAGHVTKFQIRHFFELS